VPRVGTTSSSEDEALLHDDALESQAIAATKGGDRAAYDYIVQKYWKRVMSIAWGVVRNAADAEDLAQNAFVKAFQSIDRFRTSEPFGPWIYRIVTNLALDVMKHRTKFRHEELTESEPAGRRDSAELAAVTSEIAVRIDRAIESLPEMQRVVARLFLVEEFEHAEIASMTGLAEGTVRSHLSLARKRLREQLADVYGGSDE
jgi:RNA polymerase sigma-70 factor (ECF subfamily)